MADTFRVEERVEIPVLGRIARHPYAPFGAPLYSSPHLPETSRMRLSPRANWREPIRD
jgi:hypothetical protein